MELNTSMRFVMARAQAEASAAKSPGVCQEHIFLGLLKLSELRAKDFAPLTRHEQQIDADIAETKAMLLSRGIDPGKMRVQLRVFIHMKGTQNAEEDGAQVLDTAAQAAQSRGGREITAAIVLKTILNQPSPLLQEICPQKKEESHAGKTVPEDRNGPGVEKGVGLLSDLTLRIRKMRAALLADVHGQDHVVHAFAEGMFSAEVLAASDKKRKRPRAIFVFAGPPGVGKTFLAEQAAEALAIPFKRFDMSSFSDHQAYMNLIGFEKSYKDAKPGTLTGFVKEEPHCMLLFDEVEKAHESTIHLFLQVLDAGRLTDRFLDEDIAFKDTIIIFTTNAGRALYDGEGKQNAAGIPRQTILNALETEKNPRTDQAFFPAAICSRMATGWPMLFNHLQANDLEKISRSEFKRLGALFEEQYGITVETGELLPTTLLFAEGGQVDARTLRAQTEMFFKNEIFKLCRLWNEETFTSIVERLESLRFEVETSALIGDVRPLYENTQKPVLLLFASPVFAERCRSKLKDYVVFDTVEPKKAFEIAGMHDISMVLLDLAAATDIMEWGDSGRTEQPNNGNGETIVAFDNIPMAAQTLRAGTRFFKEVHERLPEIAVYILETSVFKIDAELEMSLVRAGARGKLRAPSDDFSVFEDVLNDICRHVYLQQAAARLGAEHKVLCFDTAPKPSADKKNIVIRLRNLSLKRALSADDSNEVLADMEKPRVKFEDVIGAGEAKEELQFFVSYLKNPKKFSAQGLKPPKGVLLHGPPGTGKTLLAKAMAGESDVVFIPAAASAFVTKYQGSGPESIRTLFTRARKYAPSIIFIDEIDAIGRARGAGNTAHGEEMALNALLTEMDGFTVDPKRPVFVLAATNFNVEEGKGGMGTIDAALARRFDRKILVDLPNREDRLQFIRMMLKKDKRHEVTETMTEQLARRSTGMSLASMTSVLELANRMAVKKNVPLNDAILDEAYEVTRHGEKKDWGYAYLERVARHESGHAFMCYMAGNTPAYLTIVARGGHGGYMEHSSAEDMPLQTKEELIGRIRTALGGRAAEIAYYGEEDGISTGASGDLESATQIAKAMICSYGMDDEIGMAVLSREEAARGPMAGKINERISRMIKSEMEETIKIIAQAKPRIDRMVKALMDKNKLTRDEIETLLAK